MTLKIAISCAQQTIWIWRTLLSLILLLKFLPHTQTVDLVSSILPQGSNLSDKFNFKSLLGSSEAMQRLFQNKALSFISGEASPTNPNPHDLNKLLARFKPKQGRFDPALMDMISNFDTSGGGGMANIFGNSREHPPISITPISRRIPTSTEENGIIWSEPEPEGNKRKVLPYVQNRFSSKFRNITAKSQVKNKGQITKLSQPPNLSDSDLINNGSNTFPPFDHITDPNIRNHRLYDWEFETYKNFTHIDQDEDLMADESYPSVQVVPSSTKAPKLTTIIPSGWIPKRGNSRLRNPKVEDPPPTSASESSEYQVESGDILLNNVMPGTYVKLSSDSDEPKPRPTQRPREPLRESSTENRILPYLSSEEDRRRDRYGVNKRYKDQYEESSSGIMRDDFRPSPLELSPPVFVDPDQDFFTSTIRNPSDEKSDEFNHVPSFRPPARKRKNNYNRRDKIQEDFKYSRNPNNQRPGRYESTSKKYYSSEEEHYKKMERDKLESNRDEMTTKSNRDRDRDEPENHDERDRDRKRLQSSDLKLAENSKESSIRDDAYPYRKSDRILNQEDVTNGQRPYSNKNSHIGSSKLKDPYSTEAQGTDYHPSYHSPYGPASNEFEFTNTRGSHNDYNQKDKSYNYPSPTNNHPNGEPNGYAIQNSEQYNNEYSGDQHQQSEGGDYSNAPRDQFYAGEYGHQFNHPFAAEDSQPYPSTPYGIEESNSSWSNSFYILGGLIALSGLLAFLVPTLIGTMGKQGKHRNDLLDTDLQLQDGEYIDENTSTSPGGSGSATSGSSTTAYSDTDPTADSDLWTEIKGVYNDIVNIVRGDYGGIVDKLTGGSDSNSTGIGNKDKNKNKNPDRPNIVYRDDEDEEEDDERNDGNDLDEFANVYRNGKLRHRKGIDGGTGSSTSKYGSSSSTTENTTKNLKNKTLSSRLNYIVQNNGYPAESSRGVTTSRNNDTMAGFYLGNGIIAKAHNGSYPLLSSSTEGFMGEWAKVQLIGN